MKTLYRLLALSSVLLAVQSMAALESAKFDPENTLPRFPVPMQAAGSTKGTLVIATCIGADGRIADTLVLGYSHESLVRPTLEAMKEWKATPARLDGESVPVQMVLSFDFSLEGAVITANIANHFLFGGFERVGEGAMVNRLQDAKGLDQPPSLISQAKPRYAEDAEKQGIRGKVQVEFYIDEQGTVRMPAIKEMANPYLAAQAVEAVRAWKFTPPTHLGKPVLVAATQEFSFGEAK